MSGMSDKKEDEIPKVTDMVLPPGYRKTAMDMVKGHDLTGKTVVVTGGSSGIGIETVRAFASAGAVVINAARNKEKTEKVNNDIVKSLGIKDDMLKFAAVDLSSLKSVKAFTASLKDTTIDLLILNAGVMALPERKESADGYEFQFAVNYLANFVIMNDLAPALERAKSPRVVVVSSCAHLRGDVLFDDLQCEKSYQKFGAYASAKSAAIRLTNEFNRRHDKITCFSLHPGGIMTGLQDHMSIDEKKKLGWILADGSTNPLFKTVEQGAATSVYAALSPDLADKGGAYLEDCAPSIPSPKFPIGYAKWTQDPDGDAKLWKMTEELLA